MQTLGQPLQNFKVEQICLREERKWNHKNAQLKPEKAEKEEKKKETVSMMNRKQLQTWQMLIQLYQ